jgi:23S rRNA (uracil1939-C5)-methyltransferase
MARRRDRARDRGPAPGTIVETTIEQLGGRGDGVARLYEGPLYVPFALPGERVRAAIAAPRGEGWSSRLEAVLAAAPDRVTPACRHFTQCGGCALQHLAPAAYASFKRDLIVEALARRGLADVTVAAPALSPPGSRRRASFAARRGARRCVVGFHAAASPRVVPLAECPVTMPAIVALLPALAECLARCLPVDGAADVLVTALDGGLDVAIDAETTPDLAAREALAEFAMAQDVARLTWSGAPIAQRRPLALRLGEVAVTPPPGGFLQATAAGEHAIVTAVLDALPTRGKVADLFAGCGTISLPLASRGLSVHAIECDDAALAALAAAARTAQLPIVTEARDLERQPLSGTALDGLAAVVFDPPRAGAPAQAAALAVSRVPTVVAVSCHPGSFARDARTLVDGGYRLEHVQPIDQFLWSPHVELVAVFRRG